MNFIHWLATHGMELLQAVGIIASLGFTTAAFRKDDASRRVANLLTITEGHRKIWSHVYQRPELARVLERVVDLDSRPLTNDEALFVTFLVHHLGNTYQAMRRGVFSTRQALGRDIHWFLNLPIPRRVWEDSKDFMDPDFVIFVERHRTSPDGDQQKSPTDGGWA